MTTTIVFMPAAATEVREAQDWYEKEQLKRFPYGLFFRPLGETIYVIACFHSSRDPMIWQRRV